MIHHTTIWTLKLMPRLLFWLHKFWILLPNYITSAICIYIYCSCAENWDAKTDLPVVVETPHIRGEGIVIRQTASLLSGMCNLDCLGWPKMLPAALEFAVLCLSQWFLCVTLYSSQLVVLLLRMSLLCTEASIHSKHPPAVLGLLRWTLIYAITELLPVSRIIRLVAGIIKASQPHQHII